MSHLYVQVPIIYVHDGDLFVFLTKGCVPLRVIKSLVYPKTNYYHYYNRTSVR